MSTPIERAITALQEARNHSCSGGTNQVFMYRKIEEALAALREIEEQEPEMWGVEATHHAPNGAQDVLLGNAFFFREDAETCLPLFRKEANARLVPFVRAPKPYEPRKSTQTEDR